MNNVNIVTVTLCIPAHALADFAVAHHRWLANGATPPEIATRTLAVVQPAPAAVEQPATEQPKPKRRRRTNAQIAADNAAIAAGKAPAVVVEDDEDDTEDEAPLTDKELRTKVETRMRDWARDPSKLPLLRAAMVDANLPRLSTATPEQLPAFLAMLDALDTNTEVL